MSSGLDYSKAKRRTRTGDPLPGHWNTAGWRVEYPEEFPVVVTTVATAKQTDSKVPSKVLTG